MENHNFNPFENNSGSAALAKPQNILWLLCLLAIFAIIVSKLGLLGVVAVFGLISATAFLYILFTKPIIGFYVAIALNFVLVGLGRYVKGIPFGFGIDGILLLTYLALFMHKFKVKIDWSPANKDITILSIIWFGYSIFELINPEAHSVDAWISGRGVSFYQFLFVPLTLLLINTNKKLDLLLYVWGIFTILATLKGIIQLKYGVDFAEQAWLNEGNYRTHILFGKLRVFSFFSDAGQFGGNQAYSGVVAAIYSMSQKKFKPKLFFILVAICGFYGMLISGTRGAISVPLAGFMTYFVLSKNLKVLSIGIIFLLMVFVFFKYTNIGQGNDQIRRMRTAFDPSDASLQVRLDNQKLLKSYLAHRPFGGGIGHGGVKAQKYLPNAFLSQIATDSWYVLIWVEQGIIGLILHLFILFYTVIKGSYWVMFKIRDPVLKLKISALIAGMVGVMLASYGNAVLGGMPTALLIYASMAIMLNSQVFDTNEKKIETI